MTLYIHESLEAWTLPQTRTRSRSRFSSTLTQTNNLLARELYLLGAKRVRLKTMHREYDLRRDGTLRSDARSPLHPGVILTFEASGKQMTFPCDSFDKWQDNLRAVALSLEALPMVDRYGVTNKGEQYRGFQALPPAPHAMPSMSRTEAVIFLRQHSDIHINPSQPDSASVERAYKIAAKRLHPDAGGNNEQ